MSLEDIEEQQDDVEEQQDDVEEQQEGTEDTESTEGTGEEQEEETLGLSADEQKEAKNLYKLLKNKETAKQVIEMMARSAGVMKAETPAQIKAVKKDLKELIKDGLGPEFAFFTDKLTAVIDSVLKQERENTQEVLNRVEAKEVESETTNALNRLSRETKGESQKFEQRMIELMDRIKPSDDLSTYEYLKDLYTLASSGKNAASTKAQIADKIRRNAGNAAERLRSGTGKSGTATGPEKKGLKNAVLHAMKQMGIEE